MSGHEHSEYSPPTSPTMPSLTLLPFNDPRLPNDPPASETVQWQLEPDDELPDAELERMRRVVSSMMARENHNGDGLRPLPPIPPPAAAQPHPSDALEDRMAAIRERLMDRLPPQRRPGDPPIRYRWITDPAAPSPMQSQTQYQPTYPRDEYPWRSRLNIQQPLNRSSSEPSAQILHTPRAPSPPPLLHKVFRLSCRSCDTFFTNRGMRAVLLLRPDIHLYSTDALPANSSSPPSSSMPQPNANDPPIQRTCDCLTQTLCCHGCGNQCGYAIVTPCTKCSSSGTPSHNGANGHRFVFHQSEIVASERHYVLGEPDIIPVHPPQHQTHHDFNPYHQVGGRSRTRPDRNNFPSFDNLFQNIMPQSTSLGSVMQAAEDEYDVGYIYDEEEEGEEENETSSASEEDVEQGGANRVVEDDDEFKSPSPAISPSPSRQIDSSRLPSTSASPSRLLSLQSQSQSFLNINSSSSSSSSASTNSFHALSNSNSITAPVGSNLVSSTSSSSSSTSQSLTAPPTSGRIPVRHLPSRPPQPDGGSTARPSPTVPRRALMEPINASSLTSRPLPRPRSNPNSNPNATQISNSRLVPSTSAASLSTSTSNGSVNAAGQPKLKHGDVVWWHNLKRAGDISGVSEEYAHNGHAPRGCGHEGCMLNGTSGSSGGAEDIEELWKSVKALR